MQLSQSYYSNKNASNVDGTYGGAYLGRAPDNFSPIMLAVRSSPSQAFGATLRLEYHPRRGQFETISTDGSVRVTSWLRTGGSYSQVKYGLTPPGEPEAPPITFLGTQTTVGSPDGKFGGGYSFQMNAASRDMTQQRLGLQCINAQCCGVAVEYQTIDLPSYLTRPGLEQDRRFNLSFTLAGIGSVSNFLGAFGIGQGAMGMTGRRTSRPTPPPATARSSRPDNAGRLLSPDPRQANQAIATHRAWRDGCGELAPRRTRPHHRHRTVQSSAGASRLCRPIRATYRPLPSRQGDDRRR